MKFAIFSIFKDMLNLNHTTQNSLFGKNLNIILAGIISVPVFLIIHAYLNAIHTHNEEAVAFVATVFFLTGIFAGRYVYQVWLSKVTSNPNRFIIRLAILIVTCIVWLFFHADFPFQGRDALNLFLFWLPFAIISVGLGLLIKMIRTTTVNQLKDAQVSAAHSKSELHLLQSQLSPHFLFNTLNNLYGLSITQHEKIPPLLLKLSELLRYSVYSANDIFVPLKDEIVYINNYIDFEKIRIGDRLLLTTDFEEIKNGDIRITPMLLIVFIENAFKHSKNTADHQIFVEITLKTWASSILFSVKNSYSKTKEDNEAIDKDSGFGLASVRKRLELLYQNEYELNIHDNNTNYEVMLQLKMK